MNRRWRECGWAIGAVLVLSGTVGGAPGDRPPTTARAPEITGAEWLNTRPLSPEALSGQVRIVEFWAFACVNCVRTVPAMRELHSRFGGRGAVVIGVHTPELDRERDRGQVQQAIQRLGVKYPVVLDNDYALWRAFHNRYWPALYVVDKRGVVRRTHVGELHQGTQAWNDLLDLIDRLQHEPD